MSIGNSDLSLFELSQPPGSTLFSSSLLELLDSLARSIDLDQQPNTSKKPHQSSSPVGLQDDGNSLAEILTPPSPNFQDFSTSGIFLDSSQFDLSWEASESLSSFQDSRTKDEFLPSLTPPPPTPPPPSPPARASPTSIIIPRLSLEIGGSELDDQLEEAERAIEELITSWTPWPEADGDDVDQETDKTYYEAEFREGCMPAAINQADHVKENVDSLVGGSCVEGVSEAKPVASTSSVARLPCGKLVPLKKLSVCLRRLPFPVVRKHPGSGSDTDTGSEREEAADLPRKKQRRKLHYRQVEMGAPNGNSGSACAPTQDLVKRGMLERGRKPTGGRTHVSSDSSRSPTPEGRPSKLYPLRWRNKAVQYTLGDEGKENSGESSEGSSEEEWLGEREAVEAEEAEERATGPVPDQNTPQRETLNPRVSSDSAWGLMEPPQRRGPSALMFLGDKGTRSAEPNLATIQPQPLAPPASETGPLHGSEGPEPLLRNQVGVARPQSPTWRTVPTRRLPEPETSLLPSQVVGASGIGHSGRGAPPQQPIPVILWVGCSSSQGTAFTNSSCQPSVGSVPNMPVLWPSNSAQLLVPPLVTAPVEPQPAAANRTQLHAETSPAFPVLSSPPMVLGPLESSNPGPLPHMVPGSSPCSASVPPGLNLVQQGDAYGGLILVSSATLSPGTKITLEIPAQKISLPASQICPLCQARYFGEHDCKLQHAEPVIRSDDLSPLKLRNEEEAAILQQLPVASQQPQPVVRLPPQNSGESSSRNIREDHSEVICVDGNDGDDVVDREPSLTKSYNFREGRSKVSYVDREESSEVEQDTDSDWQGSEEELSETGDTEDDTVSPKKRRRLVSHSGGREQARHQKGRYMCHICGKRLVDARSLKQHLRLHRAFSCNQCSASFISSDQLKRHKVSHGATV